MHRNFVRNEIYTTFHTFRGMDAYWPETEQTPVEDVVRGITGGGVIPPPPPPDPSDWRNYYFGRVIREGYNVLLTGPEEEAQGKVREPDKDGLQYYDGAMRNGMTEAEMREALIRSDEYEGKNDPERG
jgi:hypothetical protein